MNAGPPLLTVVPDPVLSIDRDGPVLSLVGELDLAGCDDLRRAVAAYVADDDLVLDLSALRFIDAAGIGCIVVLMATSAHLVSIGRVSPEVSRTFGYAGVSGLLPPVPHRFGSCRNRGSAH